MKTDPAKDQAELLRLRQGDDGALDRIMARWERPLFAFAWRYLQNAADASELVTETFVRLHQQRLRLRANTNLSAWLFTTLGNLCHNQHRWRRRHAALSLDAPVGDAEGDALIEDNPRLVATDPAPDDAMEQAEDLAALASAIGHLPHDLRVTLLLHYYDQLPYREVGEIIGCSERGVETRLYRARQQLKLEMAARRPAHAAR